MLGVATRPRDYIRTADGLALAVLLDRHDHGRVIAALRYLPRPDGTWQKLTPDDGTTWLRLHHPRLVQRVAEFDTYLPAIPLDDITTVHRAGACASRLLALPPTGDALQSVARRVLELLRVRGIPHARLGVAGSLLLGATRPGSDVDLVVYGREPFTRAREIVGLLIASGELQELDEESWRRTHERRPTGLSLEDFVRHERRKRTRVLLNGVKVDLVCVPDPDEQPSDTTPFRKLGRRRIVASVVAADRAWDYPARYAVDHSEVGEIVAWSHACTGQAEVGERVEAVGWMERAADGRARLVVGTAAPVPGDQLRVLSPLD